MYFLHPTTQDLILDQINQQPGLIIGREVNNLKIYKVESIINSYALQDQQKFNYMIK